MKFLILAVSYKSGGLCVAGLDLDSLEYVRIGGKNCESISPNEFTYKTANKEIQLNILDVISIDAVKLANNGCQTENYWLKGIKSYDGTLAVADIDVIYTKLKTKSYIFLDVFDYINIDHIKDVDYSLQFVKVQNFTVVQRENARGNLKLYADFEYNDRRYSGICVTDSVFNGYPDCYGDEQKTCNQRDAYIMVSLPYNKWAFDNERFYKYVSGIILI